MRAWRALPHWLALCAVVAIVAGVSGISLAAAGSETWPPFVTVGTASPSGAYYPLGVAMADIWNRSIPGVRFSARETGGGVANLNLIASGQVEVGIANENIGYYAVLGQEPFPRALNISGGWVLNRSMGIFVVLRSSGIRSLEDLRGKRISFGNPGSAGNVLGQLLLESHGLSASDYHGVYMGWQESADALGDRLIDAAFFVGGQPFPAVSSLAARTPISLVSFDAAKLRAFHKYPLFGEKIPKEMYNLPEDGDAVLVRSIVYLSPDLPENLVYQMVRQVFSNLDKLEQAHPSGDEASLLTQADAELLRLSLHPGVVRYAKEVGVW